MKKSLSVGLLILIILFGLIAIYFITNSEFTFSAEGRYDDSRLDYMGVIYENRSHVRFFGGYSESEDCPWGIEHNGLDYFFNDSMPVIAAAPGKVEEIQKRDYEGESNAYRVSITIRFNQTVVIGYNFEPWTTDEGDREKQMELFTVKEGDWVTKGEKIANFVACAEDAHIHFDISVNHQQTCPKTFFDEEGYNEVMILLQLHWPDAELCYS